MRLIDADKLCESIMKVWDFAEKNGHKKLANAIADVLCPAIVSQPTVEAEPIRHGHWIMCDEQYNAYECSICHDAWAVEEGSPSENNMHYCQNCGAKMDEADEVTDND